MLLYAGILMTDSICQKDRLLNLGCDAANALAGIVVLQNIPRFNNSTPTLFADHQKRCVAIAQRLSHIYCCTEDALSTEALSEKEILYLGYLRDYLDDVIKHASAYGQYCQIAANFRPADLTFPFRFWKANRHVKKTRAAYLKSGVYVKLFWTAYKIDTN